MSHPLAEHYAPISAAIAQERRKEHPELEPLPYEEWCMSLSPPRRDGNGERRCLLPYGHEGRHKWE